MTAQHIEISGIPALVWGAPSDKVWLCVHGKMSSKESAEGIARIAAQRGCQTISFDLPQHGERQGESRRCDVWNGVHDLNLVCDYVFRTWREASLYACSLGAYFSLQGCGDRPFSRCLMQSPIVDMPHLIRCMFAWFGVTEERLAQEKEIDTPIDLLSWDYYQYALAHPVEAWPIPTAILYAGRDTLQSREVVACFARRFSCRLTIAEHSQHPFMDEADGPVVDGWLQANI